MLNGNNLEPLIIMLVVRVKLPSCELAGLKNDRKVLAWYQTITEIQLIRY
jgi:hypothetical protein